MPAQLRYIKYQLFDGKGRKFVDTDFSHPVEVNLQLLPVVKHDLRFFELEGLKAEAVSQLTVQTEEGVIRIDRNYKDQQINYDTGGQSDPNFLWLPDEVQEAMQEAGNPYLVGSDPPKVMEDYIVKRLYALSTRDQVGAVSEIDKLAGEMVALDEKLAKALMDAEKKIGLLEAELGKQREVDEAQMAVGEIETELANIDAGIAEIGELVAKQTEIQAKLADYDRALGADAEVRARQLRAAAERERVQRIAQEAKLSAAARPQAALSAGGGEVGAPKQAKFLLALGAAVMVIAGAGFAVSGNFLLLILGIFALVLELGIFYFVNMVTPEVQLDLAGETLAREMTEERPKDAREGSYTNNFFVDKAWREVLSAELRNIQGAVQSKLGGQSLEQTKQARTQMQAELEQLKAVIKAHEGKEIPPEQYLQKRRELDQLKVERARTQTEVQASPQGAKIEGLFAQWQEKFLESQGGGVEPLDATGEFITKLTPRFKSIRSTGQVVEVHDGQAWVQVPLEVAELEAAYIYMKLVQWQQKPILPFVFVNTLAKLPELARRSISAKMEEVKNLGQIISVSVVQ